MEVCESDTPSPVSCTGLRQSQFLPHTQAIPHLRSSAAGIMVEHGLSSLATHSRRFYREGSEKAPHHFGRTQAQEPAVPSVLHPRNDPLPSTLPQASTDFAVRSRPTVLLPSRILELFQGSDARPRESGRD